MIEILVLTLSLLSSPAPASDGWSMPGVTAPVFDQARQPRGVPTAGGGGGGGGACEVGDLSGCQHYTIAELFATPTLGGFCPPDGPDANGHYIDQGPKGGMTFSPGGGLYIAAHDQTNGFDGVWEISIPARVSASSTATMNYATFVQTGVNPTESGGSDLSDEADEGTGEFAGASGLLVYNSKLYGTLASNYWGIVTNGSAHYVRSLTLSSTSGLLGLDSFGPSNAYTRWINKFLKEVPPEQVTALGGPVWSAAGQSWSILSTQSLGPSGCTMDPEDIDGSSTYHTCNVLLGYPDGHHTLGDSSTPGPHYLDSMQIFDGVLIDGTDNTLFFGTKGDHTAGYAGYGPGTANIALHGTPFPDPVTGPFQYNYDPVFSDEGFHAWPYSSWVWNYKTSDLAKVKAGILNMWDVVPTESGPIDAYFPIVTDATAGVRRVYSAAWKRSTRQLFLLQAGAGCIGANGVIWEFIMPGVTP